ncbi:probable LRR receptor-like serine/threonine-protein kinase At3g47570 [Gossypium raimondii]|uniref:probable LRR receptor-like serine/threonine-protein kinase At3g47570 n=1 Tax=Gossypium raimondii TaxID=29730 RepID=UPI00227D6052|nr:probable LRR receptor-like serine/threonine-protein kinase At3g47570 [Gossypium raimondii]
MPSSLFDNGCLRLSYKQLLECTHGFASANLIGTGSFGSVYKGVLYQHEKPLAVKVLNLRNHGAARSFIAECEALRKIRHRNLLKIITSCSSIDYQGNEFKALVFEFMPNGSLESWLHEQHDQSRYLNFAQRLDIAIDMANAIDYLHHGCETMVVHCDLKPSNVLLDDDMVAHVADFGMAKLLSTVTSNIGSDQTSSSVIKGTIGYVAPEYGMSGSVSPEGDIYSYGIMLLEMITGRRPTCDLFHDGLSLHNFCKMALQEGLKEIFDVRLVEEIGVNWKRIRNKPNMEAEIWECFVSFTKIGVACSTEVATDRLRIRDAIIELHATKARLLRTGFYGRDNR